MTRDIKSEQLEIEILRKTQTHSSSQQWSLSCKKKFLRRQWKRRNSSGMPAMYESFTHIMLDNFFWFFSDIEAGCMYYSCRRGNKFVGWVNIHAIYNIRNGIDHFSIGHYCRGSRLKWLIMIDWTCLNIAEHLRTTQC